MDTRDVFRMIDEFSALGIKRMGFTGGEPLLREDIGNIISLYPRERHYDYAVFQRGVNSLKDRRPRTPGFAFTQFRWPTPGS